MLIDVTGTAGSTGHKYLTNSLAVEAQSIIISISSSIIPIALMKPERRGRPKKIVLQSNEI